MGSEVMGCSMEQLVLDKIHKVFDVDFFLVDAVLCVSDA